MSETDPQPFAPEHLTVRGFQQRIADVYLERDRTRGSLGTFAWLVEEVGELSRAIRTDDRENLAEEFGDVFAWLVSLASIHGVDLASAAQKYAPGCPRCSAIPCVCQHRSSNPDSA